MATVSILSFWLFAIFVAGFVKKSNHFSSGICFVGLITTPGCSFRNCGQELFCENLNSQIGFPITPWKNLPHTKRPLGNGKMEYYFQDKRGCHWSIVADKQDIVESWRYLSDPSLCRQKFSSGPF